MTSQFSVKICANEMLKTTKGERGDVVLTALVTGGFGRCREYTSLVCGGLQPF